MGQAAYDMNAVRRRRAPQTRKNVPLRVEKGGKRRLTPFQAAMQHAIQLISVALMVGFAVSLLCGLYRAAPRPSLYPRSRCT